MQSETQFSVLALLSKRFEFGVWKIYQHHIYVRMYGTYQNTALTSTHSHINTYMEKKKKNGEQ